MDCGRHRWTSRSGCLLLLARASTFDTLNFDEHHRGFARVVGPSPAGFVSKVTREAGIAITSSLDLVDSLMDASRWSEMFPCIVARASTTDIISSGMGGTRSGSIQLMQAEMQVLSPLVPIREVLFLRFCKQHAEGLWAVVDVSVDSILRPDGHHHHHQNGGGGAAGYMACRLLPSGCIVQDMNNGYSKLSLQGEDPDAAVEDHLVRLVVTGPDAVGPAKLAWRLCRPQPCLAVTTGRFITNTSPSMWQPCTANIGCVSIDVLGLRNIAFVRLHGAGTSVDPMGMMS